MQLTNFIINLTPNLLDFFNFPTLFNFCLGFYKLLINIIKILIIK